MTTEGWRPNREDYYQFEESAKIRDFMLNILPTLEKVRKTKAILEREELPEGIRRAYQNDLLGHYSILEMVESNLLELDIPPIDENLVPEETLPIDLIKWFAGHLLSACGEAIDTATCEDVDSLLDSLYFFLDEEAPESFS